MIGTTAKKLKLKQKQKQKSHLQELDGSLGSFPKPIGDTWTNFKHDHGK